MNLKDLEKEALKRLENDIEEITRRIETNKKEVQLPIQATININHFLQKMNFYSFKSIEAYYMYNSELKPLIERRFKLYEEIKENIFKLISNYVDLKNVYLEEIEFVKKDFKKREMMNNE